MLPRNLAAKAHTFHEIDSSLYKLLGVDKNSKLRNNEMYKLMEQIAFEL